MFKRSHASSKPNGEDNPFLLSFSDLLAGLLAIFILVLVVTLVQLAKQKEELRISKEELINGLVEIQNIQDGIVTALSHISQREHSLFVMLQSIKDELKNQGIHVVIAENGTVLRIPEQELQFALGKYDIPEAHSESALRIGEVLLHSLKPPENRLLLDTVFVEGHTDSVANRRQMGNWGLSTYRAISLWMFWTENPGTLSELKGLLTIPSDPHQEAKQLFCVSGYGDTRSTHGQLTGQELLDDRPEDRRIDIRFTLASSEKKSLADLNSKLNSLKDKTTSLIEKLRAIDEH